MNYTRLEKSQQYKTSPYVSVRSSRSTVEDEIDDALSHLQTDTKVENWDTKQVAQWLCSVGFESISHHFIDQEITGDILLDLNIETLKELDINTYGKRYKIMQAITFLKGESNVEKLNPHSSHLPSIPNTSVSTGAIPQPTYSRSSTCLRKSNSQSTMDVSVYEQDVFYASPRKAPLPPISNRANEMDTNAYLSVRPPSPQSLCSSGISRSNTYNTVSSGGSRKSRSRELSPDPKVLSRALSQRSLKNTAIEEDGQWPAKDNQSSVIMPKASKSTPTRQPLNNTNAHKLSVSISEESSNRSSTTFHVPEHEGWLHKQSDKYKTWNKRWFVLKGTNLFYFKSPKDIRMKGIINLRGYKMMTDETIHVGKYCFKAQHETERKFYFYTDTEASMKLWLTVLIKATISRDFRAPVMSSNQMSTVSLDTARRMRPRPPSVLMYQNPSKSRDTKGSNFEEKGGRHKRDSSYTHHIIREEEEEAVPAIPFRYLNEQEDIIDPQHDFLPHSQSHHSISSGLSEEDFDHHHWDKNQYTRWVNYHLPPNKKVDDVTNAFRDGDKLILLLESASQKKIKRPPVQKNSSASVMMLDNIVTAFKFMGREGVQIDGQCTIKDVFSGNEERILIMLAAIKEWTDINSVSST